MSVVLTVARRELSSFFRLPVGWVCIALFVFLTGVLMATTTLIPGQPATMRGAFLFAGWLLLPVIPAVSMRLISEELRTGTIEPLMTSPAGDYAVVIGKYLGGLAFIGLMVMPTLAHAAILIGVSDPAPDPGPVLAGYLCLVLLGAMYLAVGLFISSLTSNQTLAFIGTFFALLALLMGPGLIGPYLPTAESWGWLREAVAAAAVNTRVGDFARGVVDTAHLAFFVSVSVFFVFLAGVSLESRRWR